MKPDFDVIILGGGPGGYIAAERLGHTGKKVLLIEAQALGGTCLNVGCIPTKTLLNSAKHYTHARESAQFGIHANDVSFHWQEIQKWKEQVVAGLVRGVGAAEKRAGVTVLHTHGIFRGPGKVEADGTLYTSEHVILATGSVPAMPPIPGSKDNPRVLDSTGLLAIDHVPESLAVIGGGVIGVEFASLFSQLGSRVTVVEMMDEIVPFMDDEFAPTLRKAMSEVTWNLGCAVTRIEDGKVFFTRNNADEKTEEFVESETILMAVGRRPALTGWGIEESGLDYSPRGITVDDTMATNLPNVWAIGDVTGRSLLAHTAYRMGEIAAANICDPNAKKAGQVMRWHTIPWCLYSSPEAAGVGYTEKTAREKGYECVTATVPALMSGRFIAENGFNAPGSAKIIAEKSSGKILGIHALGAYSSEMIWGAAALLEMELTVSDVRQLVFPHPTVSEIIREAAWAIKL